VSANSICEKSGIRLIALPNLDTQDIVDAPQRRQCIATLVNEGLHAGGFQGAFLFARAPGQIDMPRASSLERLCGCRRLSLIDFVGRAQAGKRRAGCFERRGEGRGLDYRAADYLDAGSLEEILREG
jgi:hypothetical protein